MAASYDIVIIGGGTAGLAAACFVGRCRLRGLVLEKEMFGGQIVNADILEDYIGIPNGIRGVDLAMALREHAEQFGIEMSYGEVTGLEPKDDSWLIKTMEDSYIAQAVILATGTEPKRLGVPGEEEFLGRGVSHCATCDGAFFQGQVVAVIGGGDTALTEALVLRGFASKVLVVHRHERLRALPILQEKALADQKIELIRDSQLEAIQGNDRVTGMVLKNVQTGDITQRAASGIFPCIGRRPQTGFVSSILLVTPDGFIPTNEKMETGLPGLFAAGEVRANTPGQVSTAAGEGVAAALSAAKYIASISAS